MTQDDLALRIAGLRPGETPFLQPLGTDPESASVPDEDLQPIALAVAEQEQVPAQRLTGQTIADETVQPLEPPLRMSVTPAARKIRVAGPSPNTA